MTEEKVFEHVRRILPRPAPVIEADSTLITNGLIDSMALLDLISALEDEFSMRFSNEEMIPENFDSVAAIARLVEAKSSGSAR
jgi:acyl carrier protein